MPQMLAPVVEIRMVVVSCRGRIVRYCSEGRLNTYVTPICTRNDPVNGHRHVLKSLVTKLYGMGTGIPGLIYPAYHSMWPRDEK